MRTLTLSLSLCCCTASFAGNDDAILKAAEAHARRHADTPGKELRIEAGPLDSRQLAPCTALDTYSPSGARHIGRSHVGVRCLGPANWNILVPVRISVFGDYVTAARALSARQQITSNDLSLARGDLSQLPTGTLTDPAQALGKTLRNSVAAGHPLRNDQLITPPVIRQGQQVRVLASGEGYAVRADGKAMNTAAVGDTARVRMPSGRTITGVAQEDGTVLIGK